MAPHRPPPVDVALGLGVGLLDVVGAWTQSARGSAEPSLTPGGAALLLGAGVVLIWRRQAPFATALVVGALVVAYGLAELPDPPIYGVIVLSLATVAALASRVATVGVVAVFLVSSIPAIAVSGDSGADDWYSVLVPALAALGLGAAYRERMTVVERGREAEVAAALATERGRIARELHDVVAHHVSVMVVQAEAGAAPAEVVGDDRAVAAFDGIAATGRQAMVELRRLLDVLRDATPTGTEPRPGVDALPDLVARMHDAGLDVGLTVEGEARPIDGGLDVSAYRIVQEALTNVVRHAGGAGARVRVAWEPSDLVLVVDDDGPGAVHPSPSGRGLVGIEERVALLDGDLSVGSRPDGGYRVEARLPTGSGPRS